MGVLNKKEKEALAKELKVEEQITKDASISYDGNNLVVRIPKEIGDYLEVNEKNASKKKIRFIVDKNKREFEILDR